MSHELKTLAEYFVPAWADRKSFEVRINDRPGGFKVDDEIILSEVDYEDGPPASTLEETGRRIHGIIVYVTSFGQKPGSVVFQYRETFREE